MYQLQGLFYSSKKIVCAESNHDNENVNFKFVFKKIIEIHLSSTLLLPAITILLLL